MDDSNGDHVNVTLANGDNKQFEILEVWNTPKFEAQSGAPSDTTIRTTNGCEWEVHRSILCEHSTYFDAMLNGGFKVSLLEANHA